VDGDMKVTDLYIDKDFSVIWDINRKVLDLFNWSNIENIHESKVVRKVKTKDKPKKSAKKS
jgi:hypothetical protein